MTTTTTPPFLLSCLSKWTIPCILLLALLVERRWLVKLKRYNCTNQYYWRPKSITSCKKQTYIPIEDVETSILGTIFLNIDRAYSNIHSVLEDSQESSDTILKWTFLKHPHARIKSQFFRQSVSWNNVEPTITNYEAYVVSCEEDSYTKSLLLETQRHTTILSSSFDFIGITERLHESLIVMKLLFGLHLSDLLYITVPNDLLDFNETTCVFLVEPFDYEQETRVLNNPDYQKRIQNDLQLYQEANQKLDRTIDMLGRDIVYQELRDYVQLLHEAHDSCYASSIFPCSLDGDRLQQHSCLHDDIGCNYKCLDRFIQERNV